MCMYTPGCVGRMVFDRYKRVSVRRVLYRIYKCTKCHREVWRAVAGG